MQRREFIKQITVGGFLIANGQFFRRFFTLSNDDVDFRFTVASDGHYGEPGTDYENYFTKIVEKINAHHN